MKVYHFKFFTRGSVCPNRDRNETIAQCGLVNILAIQKVAAFRRNRQYMPHCLRNLAGMNFQSGIQKMRPSIFVCDESRNSRHCTCSQFFSSTIKFGSSVEGSDPENKESTINEQ